MKQTPTACWILIALATLIVPLAINGTVITRSEMPLDIVVWNPCALEGAGEMVALLGREHAVFSVTADANGGWHVSTHFNNQGVAGAGLTTGDKYQGTGNNRFTSTSRGAMGEFTFINNFHVTSTGAGRNLLLHETVHVTVDANGEIAASVAEIIVECR
jgi:hypothetical protein